jgi:ABC-2 type transport system ATP-binding protein
VADFTGQVAISVSGARKVYPSFGGHPKVAVEDVSFAVSPGTIHGLLGPNGAGKTTTLKMLLGLVRPTGGTFEILGVPSQRAGAKRQLGFLPEQPYFSPQLSAAQAMLLYGRLSGVDGRTLKAQLSDRLSRVGLDGRESTVLSKFSRGMLQRLGIAQALIADPRVAILDEPASGLDPVGQRDIRNLMLDLRASGTTVLLSSHQLSEVEAVCDEVTILSHGRVAAKGHIDDLLNTAGQVSVRARGDGDSLPASIELLVGDVAASGGTWIFSVSEDLVRRVVDALEDAGWHLISLAPKRDSLEDYFSRLIEDEGVDGSAM